MSQVITCDVPFSDRLKAEKIAASWIASQLKLDRPTHGFLSDCSGNKKALLIGINYFETKSELSGCIHDVESMERLIKTRGFQASNIKVLTDDKRCESLRPTRKNILEGMQWLVEGAQPNDSLFFHYSGHGGNRKDLGGDEVDNSDETICPVDYQTAGTIKDDLMNDLLVRPLAQGARLTALFDSCHSATALDLPFVYDCNGQPKLQHISGDYKIDWRHVNGTGGTDKLMVKLEPSDELIESMKAQRITEETRGTLGDVIMFAGCKDSQTSADVKVAGYGATGAASYAFINAIKTGEDMTYTQLLANMRGWIKGKEYKQDIQMSTGFPTDMNIPIIF